ncbi:MAG TPA: selenium-dependent molybdenum cofactor biosynthesis protein YqeB [Anaerolineaceae bacterium]
MTIKVLIRGGGDLGSGVALRLFHCGFRVHICELNEPLAVRRSVSFSEAVYSGQVRVEDVWGYLYDSPSDLPIRQDGIPVYIDPELKYFDLLAPDVLIDARMTKKVQTDNPMERCYIVGLGPGFTVNMNCHACIETKRGHSLGRVYYEGSPVPDTGIPDPVNNKTKERVLRAPIDGSIKVYSKLGSLVQEGDLIACVDNHCIYAPFAGIVRGIIREGIAVQKGMKVGDIDPRGDIRASRQVSDKALAIGGGVLEAILSNPALRKLMVYEL